MTTTTSPALPSRSNTAAKVTLIIGILVTILGSLWGIVSNSGGKVLPINTIIAGALTALGGGIVGSSMQDLFSRTNVDRGLSAVSRMMSDVVAENSRVMAAATMRLTDIADGIGSSARASHDSMRDTLAGSMSARFVSDELQLAPLRKVWHHYHVTQAGRELRWLYSIFPLDTGTSPATITTPIVLIDLARVGHVYNAEVGMRTNRMFINFTRADGTEPSCSEIFPQMQTFRDVHSGFGIRQTWDGSHLLGRAIMSERPVVPDAAPGMLAAEHNPTLDDVWLTGFIQNRIHLEDLPVARS
ncbi:hypothetical protein ACFROC_05020 [Nocardia tengchongensis]|uniref:hypothetical protein n=1 Tax=Nocardia tengchongensis TaxID=2055889 RepID=UPI00368380E6